MATGKSRMSLAQKMKRATSLIFSGMTQVRAFISG